MRKIITYKHYLFIYNLLFSSTLSLFIKFFEFQAIILPWQLITSKIQTKIKTVNSDLYMLSHGSIHYLQYSSNILRSDKKHIIVSSANLQLTCFYKKILLPNFLAKGLFLSTLILLVCD